MALSLARIIGTITGKVAFERTDANFQLIQTDVNTNATDIGDKATLITIDKTNLVAAVNEVKEQTNDLDANKADKVQEAWITGTLQNGWIGTLQYAKNDLGIATVKGQLTAGTVTADTAVANLPTGYLPTTGYLPIDTINVSSGANTKPGLTVNLSGLIFVTIDANFTAGQSIVFEKMFYAG